MKKMGKIMVTAVMTATLALGTVGSSMADGTAYNGGTFIDTNNLVWQNNDGTVMNYGRGTVFSDVHPEITDPEYFLKDSILYPHEYGTSVVNSKGLLKSNYPLEELQALQEFVNSFDWIHSDEFTRAKMVHDRVSNGFNGNYYDGSPEGNFSVLMHHKGVCANFAEEFSFLCQMVGLECVRYTPSYLHAACLLKIGDQWYATDPTSNLPFLSNAKTHPVDFETEYHRYEKEAAAANQKFMEENPDNPAAIIMRMNQQLAFGEITEAEYDAKYMELFGYLLQ